MFDQVKDDAPKAQQTAFIDEIHKPFNAGNIADSTAVAGNNKKPGSASINELLFDPHITATEGFKKGPMPELEQKFQPYKQEAKSQNLELPAIIPIPVPRPADLDIKRAEAQKPAPLTREQKGIQRELTKFDYGDVSHGMGMQEIKGVVQDFLKEKNRATALPAYKERFENAVQSSDRTYFETEKQQAPAIAAAELKFGMVASRINDSSDNFDKEAEKLPPAVKARAESLKAALQDAKESPKAQKIYAEAFKDYPDFVASTKKWLDDSREFSGALSELTKARQPVIDAARDEAVTRFVYKQAAELAGNKRLSTNMGAEALLMAQRAVEIENKELPKASKLWTA